MNVNSALTELESCNESINGWLQKGMWSAVAVAAILIAFQVGLFKFCMYLHFPPSPSPPPPPTHTHIHTYTHTHTLQLLLTITSLFLCHMIQETPNYSGGCLSRQRRRSKTAPVELINVTPAAASLTHIPQEPHENGPFLQGIAPHPCHLLNHHQLYFTLINTKVI